jgi:hypothetical protein
MTKGSLLMADVESAQSPRASGKDETLGRRGGEIERTIELRQGQER